MIISVKLGDLIAYLKIDDSGFQGKIPGAKQALQGVQSVAKAAGQTVATTFTAGTTAASGFLVNLLKTGIGYNSLQQNSRAALKVMLGGTEAVNKQMDQLDDFARNSPFAKQVFIQAQQQMLGFGVAVEDVIPALDAVQNAIAAQGMGAPEIDRAVYALSQMKAQGKLSGETLRDLGVLGIDAATIIGEKMGKTGAEIKAMASKPGGIPVEQVWDPLVNGLQDKFGGAVANVKQQWTGAVDRIKGATRDIGAELARPFVDPNGGGQAVVWANTVADLLRSVESQVKTVMPVVEKALGGTFDKATNKLREANAAVVGFNMKGLIRQVQDLTKYEPLIAGVGTSLFMLGLRPIPVIGQLAGGMWPLVAGIAALVAKDPELRGLGDAFQKGLGEAGKNIPDLIRQVLDLGMSLISSLAPGLLKGAEGFGEFVGAGLKLAPVLIEVVNAGVPLVGFAADLVGSLAKLPTPILGAVAAFIALKAVTKTDMFRGVSDSVTSFIGKAKEATGGATGMAGAMNIAKTAASGLGGAIKAAFMSNAPLLAVTALVTVLGYFANQAAEAKARADSYRDALKGVVTGSDEAKLAVSDLAAEIAVTGEGITWGWMEKIGAGADSFNDALKKSGSNAQEFAQAISGTDAEFEKYLQNLRDGAFDAGLSGSTIAGLTRETMKQRDASLEGAEAALDLDDATRRAAEANETYADRLSRAVAATDRLRQAEQDLAASKGDLKMAEYATKDAMDALTKAIEENASAARDANGVVDESSDAYRAFDESMIGAERAWRTQIDAMVKAKAPQDEINAKIAEGRQQLLDQATAFFGSEEAARAYLDSLGGIPDTVSTVVELGTDAAQKDIDDLYAKIANDTPEMIIDASDDPAMAKYLAMLGLVNLGEGKFALNANEDPANAKLALTLGKVDTSTGTVTIDGNNKAALDKLASATEKIRATWANVNIGAADQTDYELQRILGKINGSTAWVQVRAAGGNSGYTAVKGADGGIFNVGAGIQSFANGGISPLPNQALIQAGSGKGLINWAEGETWREAFIPYNPAKRARSLAVLDQVARDFGYSLVRPQSFANGGLSGPPVSRQIESAYSGVQGVTIQQLVVDISKVRTLAELESWVHGLGLDLGMQGVL